MELTAGPCGKSGWLMDDCGAFDHLLQLKLENLGESLLEEDALAHADLSGEGIWRFKAKEPHFDLVDEIATFNDEVADPVAQILDQVAFDEYEAAKNDMDDEEGFVDEIVESYSEGRKLVRILMKIIDDTEVIISWFGERFREVLDANAKMHEERIREILALLEPYGVTIDDLM